MYETLIGKGEVRIFDKKGNLFYGYNPQNNNPFFFNINISQFTSSGNLRYSDKKLIYNVNTPGRSVKMPKDISIIFTDTGKASIDRSTGELCLNIRYKDSSKFIIYYLYLHEMGHFLYPTNAARTGKRDRYKEFQCDKFAAKWMLKIGFNPSQVLAALKFVLGNSDEANYRYNKMIIYLNSVRKTLR